MKNTKCLVTQISSCVFIPLITLFVIVKFAPNSVARLFLNPDKLKSIIEYDQKKKYEDMVKKTASTIENDLKNEKGNLLNNKFDPVLGNIENPQITIIEYLDYRCGYCKKSHYELTRLLNDVKYKGKIRVIIKNYPVIGAEVSLYAAEVATGVFHKYPKKFTTLHSKFFEKQLSSQSDVNKILKNLGLKYSDIKNDDIRKSIVENFNFARSINVSGTPAFIIGDELIAQFMTYEQMSKKIDDALAEFEKSKKKKSKK